MRQCASRARAASTLPRTVRRRFERRQQSSRRMAAFAVDAVSVCIPAYNAAPHLDDALASILAQRADDLHIETVVVDDASTDTTAAVATAWTARFAAAGRPLRVVSLSKNGGAAAARNAAVAAATHRAVTKLHDAFWMNSRPSGRYPQATHDWILSADADDVSSPLRAATLAAAARRDPRARETLCRLRRLSLVVAGGELRGLSFGDESRRRRGWDVDIPRRRVATSPT